jgi:hypothetical protein
MQGYEVIYPRSGRDAGARDGVRGIAFREYLQELGVLPKAASLESELIRTWFTDPSTYPEPLKGKTLLLMNSKPDGMVTDPNYVATIEWREGKIVLGAEWLQNMLNSTMPALILR